MKTRKKGKFIVIDGTDGSGKATQVGLLVKKIKENGYAVKTIDFPRYYDNFFGKLIGECLSGKHGDFLAINPHIASVIYAADRWESSNKIEEWIKDGNIVVVDRYASSNQIHQGAKIKNKKKKLVFLKWLENLEFEVFKIPKPDLIVFLDVPVKITLELLKKKTANKKKRYMEGRGDAAEDNPQHLHDSQKSAIFLLEQYNNWLRIDCTKEGKIMSKKEISDLVWGKVKNLI
jgi:dTMP kinase